MLLIIYINSDNSSSLLKISDAIYLYKISFTLDNLLSFHLYRHSQSRLRKSRWLGWRLADGIEVDGVAAAGEMDGETAGEIHMATAAADGVNHGICGGEDAKQTETEDE